MSGYLGLCFYRHNCAIPFLEVDTKKLLGLLCYPGRMINRILFWTIYERFPDYYDAWCLRKNISSDDDMNKAIEYVKEVISILNCGWILCSVRLSNPLIFSGFSLIRAACIELDGLPRIGVKYSSEVALKQRIRIITNDYLDSCTTC
jgi:hypothetical protein